MSLAVRQYDAYLNILGDEFALHYMHRYHPQRVNSNVADRLVVFVKNMEPYWT
jgi:hypothetical protein